MKDCKLLFSMGEGGRATAEIKGSSEDVTFCLVELTSQVCAELNIPVSTFAAALPMMAETHKLYLRQRTKIDLGAASKQMGGGTP